MATPLTSAEIAAQLNDADVGGNSSIIANLMRDSHRTVTAVAAAGGSNVSEVTITVTNTDGVVQAGVHHLDVYLSDSAAGAGLTATTASGAVAAKAASGTDLVVYSAKKAMRVQTLATGVYILSITDSAKTAFKICVGLGAQVTVAATLVTGNYG
jgi:hypothetical protein